MIAVLVSTQNLPLTVQEADRCMEAAIAFLRRMPYREYLKTAHWARQRAYALERAEHACQLCGQLEPLEVHHRSYARLGFEHPEDLITASRHASR